MTVDFENGPRECIADGARGLVGQIVHVLTAHLDENLLTAVVDRAWAPAEEYTLAELRDWIEQEPGWFADAIEYVTADTEHPLMWEDGDVFRY